MSNRALKQELKDRHRSDKDAGEPGGGMPGGVDFHPEQVVQRRHPSELRIAPELEIELHGTVCRCGYQTNIHRTEGVDYRTLYDDLLAFFVSELARAGKKIVDDEGVKKEDDEHTAQGVPDEPEPTDVPEKPAASQRGNIRGEASKSGAPRKRTKQRRRGDP